MMIKKQALKPTLTDEVIEGSFWGGFSSFLSRFGTFIFSIILARFLFPENFGLYSLTISIAFAFMAFADLGLDQTLIVYLSSTIKNKKVNAAYSQYIFKIKFLLSFLVSFALLVLAYPISYWIYKNPNLFLPLVMASLFIFSSLFVYFLSSVFYPIKKVKYIGIREIFFQILRLILIVLVFIFLTSAYHVLGVIAAYILTNLVTILMLLLWIKKFIPHIFQKTSEKVEKSKVLKFFGFSTLVYISGQFLMYADVILLGFFVSLSYVGFYRVAITFIIGLKTLFTSLSTVLLPTFVSLQKQRLERAFNKVNRFILIFVFPISFGLLVLGKYFVKVFFGSVYLPSAIPLYILAISLITYMPTSLMTTLFFSKEKPKYIAIPMSLAFLLNLILNYVFIVLALKIFGSELWAISGAAISSLISRYYLLFHISILTRKKLNIKLENSIFIKPFISSLIMAISLVLINTFLIKDINLIIGTAEVLLGAIIYFSLMFLIKGMNRDDIEIIKKLPLIRSIKWNSKNQKKDLSQTN